MSSSSDDDATGFEPTRAYPPAPPPPQPTLDVGNALPAGTRLAEFEVLGVVGEGGFGIVYRAWDHSLKRQVAMKEYMPSSLAQRSGGLMVSVRSDKYRETFEAGKASFVKEARMLAQFDHPALVKVFRFWEANGSAYMVMPFYEGITLRQELRERKTPPDEATLLGWLGPIADALAVIHAEYYYHRDIAPDNVLLLAGSRRPVLLDFGAARRVIGDMTQDLTVILKPGYAPLEQYAEIPGMKQGPWTDVYALAALAYAAIRGRTPPPSVGRVVNDSYEPLTTVAAGRCSERVLRAIDRALAVRPEQRTPSIAIFKSELGLAPSPVDPQAMFPASQPAATLPDFDLPLSAPVPAPTPVPVPASPATSADAPTVAMPSAMERTRVLPRPDLAPAPMPEPTPAPVASPGGRRGLLAGAAGLALAGLGGVWWWRRGDAPAPGTVPATATEPPLATAAPPTATEPTPPAVAVAAPAAGFDPAEAFRRVVDAGSPGWAPTLTAPSTRLRMDRDKLVFTLSAPHAGHVYVFNHGTDGALQQLYPNAQAPALRVQAGQALTLPQRGLQFDVGGPPGTGRVLVLVSRWPREMTAFAPRIEGGFASFPTGSVATALESANAGRLPLLAGQPVCDAGAACADEFGAAVLVFEVVG
jgi:serine/threonine protein kinase